MYLFQRTLQTLKLAFFLLSVHVLWTYMEVRENLLGFLTHLRSWTAERWGLQRNMLGKKTSLRHLSFQDNIVIQCLLCIKNSSKHCTGSLSRLYCQFSVAQSAASVKCFTVSMCVVGWRGGVSREGFDRAFYSTGEQNWGEGGRDFKRWHFGGSGNGKHVPFFSIVQIYDRFRTELGHYFPRSGFLNVLFYVPYCAEIPAQKEIFSMCSVPQCMYASRTRWTDSVWGQLWKLWE